MEITIKCDSLKELHDTMEPLVILLPEKKTAAKKETADEPEKKEAAVEPKKRKTFDKNAIIEEYKKGGTYTEIAQKIGCSYATVANTCKDVKR